MNRICARFAAPSPGSPGGGGAALGARTRLGLAGLGLFLASGRELGQPGDCASSLRPEPFPSSLHPRGHLRPGGGGCLPSPIPAPDSEQSPPVV